MHSLPRRVDRDRSRSDPGRLAMSRKDEDLRRVHERLHIAEGVLHGLESWDEVSAAVAEALDRRTATETLQGAPFGFSDVQAEHVVDMRLATRTAAGRQNVVEEIARLRALLEELGSQPDDGPGVDLFRRRRRSRGNRLYRTDDGGAGEGQSGAPGAGESAT